MTISLTLRHEAIECSCGFVYACPTWWVTNRKRDHKPFWCPSCGGHGGFKEESDVERERRLRLASEAREQRERQSHDQTRAELKTVTHSRNAVKGQLTKVKRRVKEGVCPCCNRTFRDLTMHMHQEHPEWGDVDAA